MKFLLVFVSVIVFAVCQDAKDEAAGDAPKTYQRLIPADVLRGEYTFVFYLVLTFIVNGF